MQQHGAQQFLGRDAGPSAFAGRFVHSCKQPIHFHQRLARHLAYRAQRMVGRHKVFQAIARERAFDEGVCSAHGLVGLVSGQKKGQPQIIG